MKYCAKAFNISNTSQYGVFTFKSTQNHVIPYCAYNIMECHAIQCKSMQYHLKPYNNNQYHSIAIYPKKHLPFFVKNYWISMICRTFVAKFSFENLRIFFEDFLDWKKSADIFTFWMYVTIEYTAMKYYPIPCNTMQYHWIWCTTIQ